MSATPHGTASISLEYYDDDEVSTLAYEREQERSLYPYEEEDIATLPWP